MVEGNKNAAINEVIFEAESPRNKRNNQYEPSHDKAINTKRLSPYDPRVIKFNSALIRITTRLSFEIPWSYERNQ